MDVGSTNGWDMTEVMPSKDVIAKIHAKMPLVQLSPTVLGETSERWGYQDGTGEIGVISSVTQAFCADCNRARLSTEGKLYLCLFATQGHDLRSLLRDGASNDTDIASAVQNIWQARSDNYSELRASGLAPKTINIKRVEMSYIGG
jgi:cyclic pyranopterin phosphate synthase